MGQFTQIDPIGFGGGLNLYGYANGDPVNFRDPSGLMPDDCPRCYELPGITVNVDWPGIDDLILDGATAYCGPGRLRMFGECVAFGGEGPRVSPGGGLGSAGSGGAISSKPIRRCVGAWLGLGYAVGETGFVMAGAGIAAKGLGLTVQGIRSGHHVKSVGKAARAFGQQFLRDVGLLSNPIPRSGVGQVANQLGLLGVNGGVIIGTATADAGGLELNDLWRALPVGNIVAGIGDVASGC